MVAPGAIRREFSLIEALGYKLRCFDDEWVAWHHSLTCYTIYNDGRMPPCPRYRRCKMVIDSEYLNGSKSDPKGELP